jgi:pimeloyl-ACP methyl ester carboxylesterase
MEHWIFYTDAGSGLPVVFIHGYCETHHIWDEYSRKLSKSHRVITIDLPGFGKTPLPAHQFTLEDIAASIHELLTILGAGHHVMIGHSLGGYITLAYVKKYSEEIRGFGLFHSSALADSPDKKETRTKLIDFISENGVPPFIQNFIPSLFYEKRRQDLDPVITRLVDEAKDIPAGSIREYARAMRDREDNTALLRKFTRPVMMIIGENDGSVPFSLSIEQSRMLQRPYVLTLKETGHMGMYERSAETLHFVQNFLNVC